MFIVINLAWLFIIIAVVLFLTHRHKDSASKDNEDRLNALRTEWSNTLANNTDLILKQLNSMNSSMGSQMSSTTRVFGEVRETLGSLEQKTQQIYEVGKDISSLQEILRAPKMRGGLGELLLENLLAEIMPKNLYELQHSFKSGDRVDAVINIGKKLVPVDSKFPMESFTRFIGSESEEDKKRARKEFTKAVKEHVNNVADKYILPDENTYEFALMYIPAENVYYEAFIKSDESSEQKSMIAHAASRKVFPVSPNSFYAYLEVIVIGLKGLGIQEKTKDVIKKLLTLKGSLEKFKGDFDKLGTHIKNIGSSYGTAKDRLDKFGNKLTTIDSLDTKKQLEEID